MRGGLTEVIEGGRRGEVLAAGFVRGGTDFGCKTSLSSDYNMAILELKSFYPVCS